MHPVILLAATIIHVALHGTAIGGGPDAPLNSIQKAVDRAQPGDTVVIHAGTYRERVTIRRGGSAESPVRIAPLGDGEVIIDAGGKDAAVKIIDVAHLELDSLVLTGARDGLSVVNSSNLVFTNVTCRDNQRYGSFWGGTTTGSHDIVVRDCLFFLNGAGGKGAGMRIGDRRRHFVYNMLIENCVSHSNAARPEFNAETGTGININSPEDRLPERLTRNITVRRCAAYNNGSSGFSTQLPAEVVFEDCASFDNNVAGTSNGEGVGLRIGFTGDKIAVRRCISFHNRSIGIAFEHITGGEMSGCLAYDNSWKQGGMRRGVWAAEPIAAWCNVSFGNGGQDVEIAGGSTGEAVLGIEAVPAGALLPRSAADLGLRTWINGREYPGNDTTSFAEIWDRLEPLLP